MRSTQLLTTSVVGLAALLAACADAPTMAPLAPTAPSTLIAATVSIGDQATFGTVATERFRVCKNGSSANFSYAIDYVDATPDETGTFSLNDGQCAEVAQKGGTGANVAVTETSAQTGFVLDRVDVITASGAACATFTTSRSTSAGPTASGLISGTAGGTIPCRGVLANFFNVAEPPPPPPPAGCTLTIGYWKTHAGFTGNNGDDVTQYLPIWLGTAGGAASTQVTSAAQAVSILSMTGGASNGIVKLKAQLLGAKLNNAAGASNAAVAATITAADAFLATNAASAWSSLSNATKSQVNGWMTTIDNYNNGLVGPGHCGS